MSRPSLAVSVIDPAYPPSAEAVNEPDPVDRSLTLRRGGSMELKAQASPYPERLPEHRFWIGLACVALLHASAILSAGRSLPRQLGERDGSPDAISVELVDPSELGGPRPLPPMAPSHAAPPPVTPADAVVKDSPPPPPPRETATAASPTMPPPVETASPSPPVAPRPQDKTALAVPSKQEAAPSAPTATPSPPSAAAPGPPASPPPEPAGKAKPSPKLSLQLDLPPNFVAPSGLSTAAVRPPDITRSGENDEFGRRVIRALRQTMPPARGENGKVTVRLLLSPTGDLSELQLVRPAADAALTQSVVFAVRQSSFPIPPTGATRSDRTFLVTYIYN
jgi:periplasmic protein TonB